MFKHLLIVAAFALSLPVLGQTYSEVGDIPYSPRTDAYSASRCRLDVYYPEDTSDCPVVVWFHGGGLTGGKKKIPAPLKKQGVVVIAPNYRLLPEVDVADCIDDAAAAVAWAFQHAREYGGSPRKLIVAGHSAGGYLTSMIGLDKSRLSKYGIDADSIKALVPFSGQVITHFAKRRAMGMSELQPMIDTTAPLYHVRKDAPPYIIITGDRNIELYGRHEENAYMWRMMKLTGHPCVEIYELDGFNHSEMATPAHQILKKAVKRFTTH